jgi:DnaA family protein
MLRPRQLSLQIMLDDAATFDNFHVTAANAQALDYLRDATHLAQFTWLWGVPGAGCSHLLQALCQQEGNAGGILYMPLQMHAQFHPEMLEGLEALDMVCLDDVEHIAGNADWELALFSLFNRLRDSGTRLLIAGRSAPRQLQVQLPDLLSRLQLGLVFQVHELTDEDKIQALQKRARLRGMDLSDEVAHYVLQRTERSSKGLFSLLERLDEHSLRSQRRITIPLVREVFQNDTL